MSENIRIGVSACIAGEKVRWNNTDARDAYLTDTLAKYVEFVPLCPEIACGMGIPREKVRQVDCNGDVRLIGYESGDDLTEKMTNWTDRILPGLDKEDLCGFVLESRSPCCALMQGKIFSTTGNPPRRGAGFFAKLLMTHYPLLPVEASDRLQNPILRENFIRRVFVLKRWRELTAKGLNIGNLVDFHTRHKMMIRSHNLRGYRELGKLLGECSIFNADEIFDTYGTMLFRSLALKATPTKNAEILTHAMGYFKKQLNDGDAQELRTMIIAYKNGKIPLVIPLTLLNHYARKHQNPYLMQQYFLNPHPSELKLLNHV